MTNSRHRRVPNEFWIAVTCLVALSGLIVRLLGHVFDRPGWIALGEWLTRPLVFLVLLFLAIFLTGIVSTWIDPLTSEEIAEAEKEDS